MSPSFFLENRFSQSIPSSNLYRSLLFHLLALELASSTFSPNGGVSVLFAGIHDQESKRRHHSIPTRLPVRAPRIQGLFSRNHQPCMISLPNIPCVLHLHPLVPKESFIILGDLIAEAICEAHRVERGFPYLDRLTGTGGLRAATLDSVALLSA
jgi:hypothetical protein